MQESLGEPTWRQTQSCFALTLGNEQAGTKGSRRPGLPYPGRQVSQLCLTLDFYIFQTARPGTCWKLGAAKWRAVGGWLHSHIATRHHQSSLCWAAPPSSVVKILCLCCLLTPPVVPMSRGPSWSYFVSLPSSSSALQSYEMT